MTRILRAALAVAIGAPLALVMIPTILASGRAVEIAGFAFSPQALMVGVGDSVTWSNGDAANHTATADDGSFDTGTITSSTPKSVTFSTAGTFGYHCAIHPAMTGTVVVQATAVAGGSAPPTDSPPAPADRGRSGSTGWPELVLAGLVGLLLAGRRFARRTGVTDR